MKKNAVKLTLLLSMSVLLLSAFSFENRFSKMKKMKKMFEERVLVDIISKCKIAIPNIQGKITRYLSKKKDWVSDLLDAKKFETAKTNITAAQDIKFSSKKNSHFNGDYFNQELDFVSHSELTANNSFELLQNGKSFEKKIELINNAKSSIAAVYLQIVCDDAGKKFIDALVKAAARGVDVWVIVSSDWMYSKYQLGTCESTLNKSMVNFKYTNHPGSSYLKGNAWKLHDKILVIDLHNAVVGGQNIASWWSDSNGNDANFRDTDVLVNGPIVTQIAKRFTELWTRDSPSVDSNFNDYEQELTKMEKDFRNEKLIGSENYSDWFRNSKQGLCRFVTQDPHLKTFYVIDSYSFLVNHAESSITMQIPQVDMIAHDDFKRLHLYESLVEFADGVGTVNLLTNSIGFINSNPLNSSLINNIFINKSMSIANETGASLFESVNSTKFHVYGLRPWLHGKMWLIDDMVSIGSFNFDSSATVWTEDTLLCLDRKLQDKVKSIMLEDVSLSRLVNTAAVDLGVEHVPELSRKTDNSQEINKPCDAQPKKEEPSFD